MNIRTNKPGTKLTRPVSIWMRLISGVIGLLGFLMTLGALESDAGWATLIPLVFAVGGLIGACQKTETIG